MRRLVSERLTYRAWVSWARWVGGASFFSAVDVVVVGPRRWTPPPSLALRVRRWSALGGCDGPLRRPAWVFAPSAVQTSVADRLAALRCAAVDDERSAAVVGVRHFEGEEPTAEDWECLARTIEEFLNGRSRSESCIEAVQGASFGGVLSQLAQRIWGHVPTEVQRCLDSLNAAQNEKSTESAQNEKLEKRRDVADYWGLSLVDLFETILLRRLIHAYTAPVTDAERARLDEACAAVSAISQASDDEIAAAVLKWQSLPEGLLEGRTEYREFVCKWAMEGGPSRAEALLLQAENWSRHEKSVLHSIASLGATTSSAALEHLAAATRDAISGPSIALAVVSWLHTSNDLSETGPIPPPPRVPLDTLDSTSRSLVIATLAAGERDGFLENDSDGVEIARSRLHDADNVYVLMERGLCAQKKRNYFAAVELLTQASVKAPSSTFRLRCCIALGWACVQLGAGERDELLDPLAPRGVSSKVGRGIPWGAKGAEIFRYVLRKKPESVWALCGYARALSLDATNDAVRRGFQTACANQRCTWAPQYLGDLCAREGNLSGAAKCYQERLASDPKSSWAKVSLALTMEEENPSRAELIASAACDDPSNEWAVALAKQIAPSIAACTP